MVHDDNDQPVLCLMGPTASGKTSLALAMAREAPVEVVSVDSALVYRGMDIGTAKPTLEERALCPHHLLDLCDPAEAYSAARFVEDAEAAIDDIRSRGRIPVLVGGTMLYFKALLQGLADLPPADPDLRSRIAAEAAERGWEAMHAELARVDPETAARLHPNDPQRIQRALEVFRLSGRPLSLWHREARHRSRPGVCVAVAPESRRALDDAIRSRFDAMLAAGFEQEVRQLMQRSDLHPDLPSMRSVGYRQMWAYLAGELDYATMREKAIVATGQLAKRQLTWIRRWQGILVLRPGDPKNLPRIMRLLDSCC
jgi:tRNA dimethylallyltransferase